jgi:hypothetical protein
VDVQTKPDDRQSGDDRPLEELDDTRDREELRNRYYGLIQELRVMLPGAQILVAFLLTAPFASGFEDLDHTGRQLFGLALVTGALAIVAFTTPTAIHRIGPRRSRLLRLRWGIRMARFGLAMVAVSLTSAITTVVRLVYSDRVGILAGVLMLAALATCWVIVPMAARPRDRRPD